MVQKVGGFGRTRSLTGQAFLLRCLAERAKGAVDSGWSWACRSGVTLDLTAQVLHLALTHQLMVITH